jgi:hypothetical protein
MSGFAPRRNPEFWLPVLFVFLCGAVHAAAERLPPAGQVLDRYVSVTGGATAWNSKRVERDEVEGRTLDGERVVLRATVTTSRAGNSISEVQVPEAASEGIYKGVAWADSAFSGVRIKHGTEREEAIRDSRMLEEGDWRELYPKSTVNGIETVGGEPCYKVLLLPSAAQKIEWFSISSGLLMQRTASEISTSGDTPVGYRVETWAEFGGVREPSAMLAWRGDFQYRLRVLSTVYNPKGQVFDYPAEVAEYVKADRSGKALPNAEEIIERHIFESGGPEFYATLRTQKVTGTLTLLARNLEGRMETWSAGGGKYYQSTDIPGLGKQEEGSDGEIAWDRSPLIGPRLKPRRNSAALGVTLDAAGMLEWRSLIARVRTEAQETVAGRDCYRVRLSPRDGSRDMVRWYDRTSGLLYRSDLTIPTDMGTLPIVMTFEEYRDVNGVKWPSRIHIAASGQETLFAADEVKLNEPVDDSIFEVPAEIRELVQKKADADASAAGSESQP